MITNNVEAQTISLILSQVVWCFQKVIYNYTIADDFCRCILNFL